MKEIKWRRPPAAWRNDLDCVLIREGEIRARVTELAGEIQEHYQSKDLVIVALLNGTVMFLADLIRHLEMPVRLDFMGVSSYGSGTTSSGKLVMTKDLKLDVTGRHVLLVDDVLDTGRTLRLVLDRLKGMKPRSIRTCVFLEKKARRVEKVRVDYVGFEIPDAFVVGYGLDFAERYRNLPFVGVLHERMYKHEG